MRLVAAGDGTYYVQTGYGNYLFTGNITTRVSALTYTEEELLEIWEFHKLVDPLSPTASEVYTIEAEGKADTEQRWIFVPTGFATTDILLHTVYNEVSSEPALRLYASFDQAATWKEFFTILPANAGISAMQKLSDGNLAIFFEDGSIGGGEGGCYALNCVVIKDGLIQEQAADVLTATIIREGETDGSAPYVNGAINPWTKSFATQDKTGVAGVQVSSSYNAAFNREGNGTQRVLCMKPSAASATDEITITAPAGYIIKSYTLTGYNKETETYTLTAEGVTPVTFDGGKSSPATLTVDNVDATSLRIRLLC